MNSEKKNNFTRKEKKKEKAEREKRKSDDRCLIRLFTLVCVYIRAYVSLGFVQLYRLVLSKNLK